MEKEKKDLEIIFKNEKNEFKILIPYTDFEKLSELIVKNNDGEIVRCPICGGKLIEINNGYPDCTSYEERCEKCGFLLSSWYDD